MAMLISIGSFALEVPPTPNRLVNDYAGVLGNSNVNRLETKLRNYMDTTSTQIAVVVIPSLEGDDLFDYSQRLAEKWGIGGGENDNGVLLFDFNKGPSYSHAYRIRNGRSHSRCHCKTYH